MYQPTEEKKADLLEDIRFVNNFHYAIQKHRLALGAWIDAKKRDKLEVSKRVNDLFDKLKKDEDIAKKMTRDIVTCHPMWPCFFDHISGIGESLAAALIAEIKDINRFSTVSTLWAYAGLIGSYVKAKCSNGHKMIMSSDRHKSCPVFKNDTKEVCGGEITVTERVEGKSPKRIGGYHYLFNSRLKTISWKISGQLVKQGNDFYRKIYYTEKEKQANLNPDFSKGYIDNRARRKMVKILLAHLWEAWRKLQGLEIRPPYVVEKLGHQGWYKWADVKQIIIEEKKKLKEK